MPYSDDPGPHVPSFTVEARGVLPAPEEGFLKQIFCDWPFSHHAKDDSEDDSGVPAVELVHRLDIAAGGSSHKITIGIPLRHGRTITPTVASAIDYQHNKKTTVPTLSTAAVAP